MYLVVSRCISMYLDGTHQDTCTIHARYILDTWDTYPDNKPPPNSITNPPSPGGDQRIGVYQSFAKFREKFARSAAGAEIFRNLPLTAPLASQAHAVHMYRIIIERFLYGPRSLGGHLR